MLKSSGAITYINPILNIYGILHELLFASFYNGNLLLSINGKTIHGAIMNLDCLLFCVKVEELQLS